MIRLHIEIIGNRQTIELNRKLRKSTRRKVIILSSPFSLEAHKYMNEWMNMYIHVTYLLRTLYGLCTLHIYYKN